MILKESDAVKKFCPMMRFVTKVESGKYAGGNNVVLRDGSSPGLMGRCIGSQCALWREFGKTPATTEPTGADCAVCLGTGKLAGDKRCDLCEGTGKERKGVPPQSVGSCGMANATDSINLKGIADALLLLLQIQAGAHGLELGEDGHLHKVSSVLVPK